MEVRSPFKMFFGLMFVILGSISIFDLWSVLSFEAPWQTWPIAVIVIGVLFMCNQKGFAFAAIGMMIVLGIFSTGFDVGHGEFREFSYEFDLDDIDYVDLDLDYGVGTLVVARDNRGDILFSGSTYDFDNPVIDEEHIGDKKIIRASRDDGSFGINEENDWVWNLSDDVVYDFDFDYGVADVELDLRGLEVARLDISEGVSDTLIIFGEYPTEVYIEGGISNVNFEFKEGSGVVIRVDGGILNERFDGFTKRDGRYYSEGYDEDGDNIMIRFEGGISDLNSVFYS